jgi:tetratricopeptide (TPR) repeat protein
MSKSISYSQITRLLSQKEFEKAAQLRAHVSDLRPNEAIECDGNELFYRGRFQQALDVFRKLMEKEPTYFPSRYYYLVAVQLERQGELRQAFDYYRSAIETEPAFVDAYIEMAGLLAKQTDFEHAARALEEAVELDPDDLKIYANLHILYRRLVETKPEVYKVRLDRLEADYDALSKRLGPLPENHRW